MACLISFNSTTLQLPPPMSHSAAPVTALATGEGKVTAAGDASNQPPPIHPNTAVPCGLLDTVQGEHVPKSFKPTVDDSSISVQQPICPFHLSVSALHWGGGHLNLLQQINCSTRVPPSAHFNIELCSSGALDLVATRQKSHVSWIKLVVGGEISI